MAQKTISSRIQLKNDTEAKWESASSFKPKQGEAIVYRVDSNHPYPRIKIGDGNTTVGNLPFVNDVEVSGTLATGTQVGVVSINGVDTTLYTPREPAITAQVVDEQLNISATNLESDAPVSVLVMQSEGTPTAEFIMSTNSAASNTLTGTLSTTDTLVNGKIIYYMTAYALTKAEMTLTLQYSTSSNTTGAIPIYLNGVRCKVPYPASCVIPLLYYNSRFYVIGDAAGISL